jgi:hypothetical protein
MQVGRDLQLEVTGIEPCSAGFAPARDGPRFSLKLDNMRKE